MDDVAGHAYRRIRGCCFFFHLGSAGTNNEASAKKASAEIAIHQWSETAVEETAVEETLRQGACARGFAPEICDDQTRCEICG